MIAWQFHLESCPFAHPTLSGDWPKATLRSGSVWPKADPTRTQSVAKGLSFRAYAIGVAAPKAISPKGYATRTRSVAKGLSFRAYAIALSNFKWSNFRSIILVPYQNLDDYELTKPSHVHSAMAAIRPSIFAS
ncbi:MAG: hypothetical protein F6K55_18865 [Moorea sp. SIO4A3]|nr:hypothetical protein [Moorena sp. SIO4A3]